MCILTRRINRRRQPIEIRILHPGPIPVPVRTAVLSRSGPAAVTVAQRRQAGQAAADDKQDDEDEDGDAALALQKGETRGEL